MLLLRLGIRGIRDFGAGTPYENPASPNAGTLADRREIQSDISLLETQRVQLAKARIGQGFRKRVILLEGACRVTGVCDTRVLIASHIKPWRDSDNAERINGNNGILLSPHVDALFDEELLTFEDDGRMRVHPSLAADVLDRWSIDTSRAVAPFRNEQQPFLERHRERFAQKLR